MKNKGFTLTELLAVIVLLGIVSTLATLSVNYIINKSRDTVYENFEANLKTGCENYLFHILTDDDPTNDNIFPTLSETVKKIDYSTLKNGFVDEMKDPKGGNCDSSYVVVTRKEDKGINYNLEYKVCLICVNDDGTENYITNYEDEKYDDTEYDDYVCEKDT